MALLRRIKRRVMGMLYKRLEEARLDEVDDPRDRRGRRWKLETLLRSALLGLLAGMTGLRAVETLTDDMTEAARAELGVNRRVPDTTLRETLCRLEPAALRPCLHAVAKRAHRRKALSHDGLPFGVVSFDGKGTAVPSSDDWYAQRQTSEEGKLVGVVRTITVTLTSSSTRVCLDVTPIPASTNEMGVFQRALQNLITAYKGLDLFRLVTYDTGALSKDNADAVRAVGLHYLFGLKGTQPTLFNEAHRLLKALGPELAVVQSADLDHGNTVIRRLYVTEEMDGFGGWEHLKTVLRVETETLDEHGRRVSHEDRYFVSSLPRSRLKPNEWLLLVRRHWGVETTHQILDTALQEDDHPWIESNPRATAVVFVLRRIAYTLLALWKYVTLRSDEQHNRTWPDLIHDLYVTLLQTSADDLSPAPA